MSSTYGFIGLGIMGKPMALNLLRGGHRVIVWNRSPEKCSELVAAGAIQAQSPAEVIEAAPISFGMLADPQAARTVCFADDGVLAGIEQGKAYVDMSTVDPETACEIDEAIRTCGGRFLEAPVSGTKKPAEDGTLIILAAGDQELFRECESAFDLLGKKTLYLGPTGNGARMKLIVNMIMGGMMGIFSEGMALTDRSGLRIDDLLDVLGAGAMANPMFALKGGLMQQGAYAPSFPLKHMQKDLRLAIELGDTQQQSMPVAAAANEAYKRSCSAGDGDLDMCALYRQTR